MSSIAPKTPPPDQAQRERALDPMRSILVQAPAGSGKTTLLTERCRGNAQSDSRRAASGKA
jgi:ATP/maltotriose-dependent transcriptional regulator MalT